MRYFYLLSAFLISAVVATPMEQAKRDLELDTRACLPTGCGTAGCCSGDCDWWCDQCGIPYSC